MTFRRPILPMTRRHFVAGSLAAGTALTALGSLGLTRAWASTPESIREAGRVRVGCEAAYRPFAFRENGRIVGYDVDLAHLLFEPLGVEVEMVDTAWAGVIPSLYAGNFDIVMTSLTYTPERIERVGYSIPYTEATQELLIRASDEDTITSLEGMAGKVLAVKLGSAGDTMRPQLEEQLIEATGEGFASVRVYDDHPAAYMALAQGTVDGVVNTLATLTQVLQDAPDRYAIVRDVGPRNWAGIGTRQEDTELITFLDERIRALRESGEIYELQERWFGMRMELIDHVPDLV